MQRGRRIPEPRLDRVRFEQLQVRHQVLRVHQHGLKLRLQQNN